MFSVTAARGDAERRDFCEVPGTLLDCSGYMNLPMNGWSMGLGSTGATGMCGQCEEEDSEGGCEGGNCISVKTVKKKKA